MIFKGLDLNLLVALDALLTEQNVTRAAEQLNVTQPAMSAALNKLRVYFGDVLLQRVGRRLELTPRAEAIRTPVKELLANIQNVMSIEAQFEPELSQREFSLSMSHYCEELVATPLLRHVQQHAPHVQVRIERLGSRSLDMLREGRVDACITVQHSELLIMTSDSDFDEECLFADEWVLACDPGTATGADGMSYAEFCERPYVDVHFGRVRSNASRTLARQPRQPRTVAVLPSFVCAMEAVAGSNRVALVPLRAARAHAPRLGLRIMPAPLRVPRIEEVALFNKRSQFDPGHAWLRGALRAIGIELSAFDFDASVDRANTTETAVKLKAISYCHPHNRGARFLYSSMPLEASSR